MDSLVYRNLISAVQLVALPFEQQAEELPSHVCRPDEIALIFDDAYQAASGNDKATATASFSSAAELMDQLDVQLERMSANRSLWSDDALRDREEWSTCRELARSILEEFGVPLERPNLTFITFVEGA